MRGFLAIVRKEFRTYFYSPVGYVTVGIFLFVMGIIFARFVSMYFQFNMAQRFGGGQGVTLDKLAYYFYQNMAFILCFITPFVTMRLFSEEKRQQTLELLLTAPLRTSQIVLAKFSGAFLLLGLMLAITLVYVLFLVAWGNPDVRIIAATYLGLVLSSAFFISLGGLISSFTGSQAISAVLSFIAFFMFWLIPSLGQGITATTGPIEWGPLLTYLSPVTHFNSFAEGLIQLKDTIFFLTMTSLFLFLTHRVVDGHRWR